MGLKEEEKVEGKIRKFWSKEGYLRLRIILFWGSIIPLCIAIRKENLLILLVFHVLFYYVLLFNSALAKEENILRLSKGEMRRAIAIILTIAFISTLFLDLAGSIKATHYTKYFAYGVYAAIISFYFGFRTAEKKKIEEAIKEVDGAKILERRYAIGELSEEEFERMKEQLGIK